MRHRRNRKLPDLAPIAAALLLLAPACAPRSDARPVATRAELVPVMAPGQAAERIQVGDVLLIHAPLAPEVDLTRHTVAADGLVRLRLIGAVEAVGETPEQVAATIQARLARYYKTPRVVVEVVDRAGRRYVVLGEVREPGPRALDGRETLLSALAAADPLPTAQRDAIVLIRREADGGVGAWRFDLDQLIRGDAVEDVPLRAGDVIDVPPTRLAQFGRSCAVLFGHSDPPENRPSQREETP